MRLKKKCGHEREKTDSWVIKIEHRLGWDKKEIEEQEGRVGWSGKKLGMLICLGRNRRI